MQLHEVLKNAGAYRKEKTRVGRGPGSGIGKTCGRGGKGATARSGYRMPATYAGGQMPLFRRLPKRGFTNAPFKTKYQVVNVGDLACFDAGAVVTAEDLTERRLAAKSGMPVKILGGGDLPHALTIRAHAFSSSARSKIEKAGGKVETPDGKPFPVRKKPFPAKKVLGTAEADKGGTGKDKLKGESSDNK